VQLKNAPIWHQWRQGVSPTGEFQAPEFPSMDEEPASRTRFSELKMWNYLKLSWKSTTWVGGSSSPRNIFHFG
jgi:hypothetical protein